MSIADRLDLWRTIEALTVQDAARLDPHDPFTPVYGAPRDPAAVLPWQDAMHAAKHCPAGKEWRYDAQCGIHRSDMLAEKLLAKVADGEYRVAGSGGHARLFDLSFDADGYPIARTFLISLAAWAAGQVLCEGGSLERLRNGGRVDLSGLPRPEQSIPSAASGFAEFDSLSRSLVQWVINETALLKEQNAPADMGWIERLVALALDRCGLPADLLDQATAAHVRSVQVRTDGQSSDRVQVGKARSADNSEILSSFYIEELARLQKANAAGDLGAGFVQLMSPVGKKQVAARIDVRSDESHDYLAAALAPARMPPGRWPSDHALVFSQQMAVNEAWKALADQSGLFAVNGPPGTGKTTLLRDVVAAVVTRRAEIMVGCGSPFGSKQALRIGDTWVPYYPLANVLQGHSIVIASSNNGAVENLSLELPGLGAVPERVARRSDYFKAIADNVSQREAWGLLAAPLGNSHNRREFLQRFWWAKRGERNDLPTAGMREHLKVVQTDTRAAASNWQRAVGRFSAAAAREASLREALELVAKRPARIASLTSRLADAAARLDTARAALGEAKGLLGTAEMEVAALRRASLATLKHLADWERRSKAHSQTKPGILGWIVGLGRAQRRWSDGVRALQAEHAELAMEWKRQDDSMAALVSREGALRSGVAERQSSVDGYGSDVERTRQTLEAEQRQLKHDRRVLGSAWLVLGVDQDEREKASPWASPDWMAAREELFLAALDVHRAFVENHAIEILANLNLANDWLAGKTMPGSLALTAMESLCLVVPAISTTFASVPRMLANIGREEIGWLLIDEAGQALTQHAAGAVWRAKRTVVVGDPLQLEPVYSMPAPLEASLGAAFNVPQEWWPSVASLQGAADRSAKVGTAITRESGEATWVGCPLRLHRRCDEPMFSISNRIAYGGLMVHGKTPSTSCALPGTAWIDVRADSGEGHWIPEEGEQAERLLSTLIERHQVPLDQIALISPFRDCARKLRHLAGAYSLDPAKVGTVHTAQGREADVVILVLGGNPKVQGAKAWAAAKPNLLNVAVSRAKRRLFVIGNHSEWRMHQNFDVVAGLVPLEAQLVRI